MCSTAHCHDTVNTYRWEPGLLYYRQNEAAARAYCDIQVSTLHMYGAVHTVISAIITTTNSLHWFCRGLNETRVNHSNVLHLLSDVLDCNNNLYVLTALQLAKLLTLYHPNMPTANNTFPLLQLRTHIVLLCTYKHWCSKYIHLLRQ